MDTQYFERDYCFECCAIHWVEKPFPNRVICHGYDFFPRDTPTQYTRKSGKGIEVRQTLITLPLEWEILASTPAPIDPDDDF